MPPFSNSGRGQSGGLVEGDFERDQLQVGVMHHLEGCGRHPLHSVRCTGWKQGPYLSTCSFATCQRTSAAPIAVSEEKDAHCCHPNTGTAPASATTRNAHTQRPNKHRNMFVCLNVLLPHTLPSRLVAVLQHCSGAGVTSQCVRCQWFCRAAAAPLARAHSPTLSCPTCPSLP